MINCLLNDHATFMALSTFYVASSLECKGCKPNHRESQYVLKEMACKKTAGNIFIWIKKQGFMDEEKV